MKKMEYCMSCMDEKQYEIQIQPIQYQIKGKKRNFNVAVAICKECGSHMNLSLLMDRNVAEIDRQYREQRGIVTVEEIETLMKLYHIGKAPVSLALGFGEITITRYLIGHMPSVKYSAIIRRALVEPDFMLSCLEENREKVGELAYSKARKEALELRKRMEGISPKMLSSISYIFEKQNEVTPFALHKLLYYIQALSMVNGEGPLFDDECQAWIHGPVYPVVYDMLRDFSYRLTKDYRYALIKKQYQLLSSEECQQIDLVLNTFGMYSERKLEEIMKREGPWIEIRRSCFPEQETSDVISLQDMREFWENVAKNYDLTTEDGIFTYIG